MAVGYKSLIPTKRGRRVLKPRPSVSLKASQPIHARHAARQPQPELFIVLGDG
jgi:hypothetical protein